jgi:hypothetical protein
MNTVSPERTAAREATIVRLGGLAGLSMIGLYILITFVQLGFPGPSGVPLRELKTYVSEHQSAMATAQGLRYLVLCCIAFFAVGMYVLTGRGATLVRNGWGILGLVGATALIATGTITNSVESMAFLNFADLSEQPEHLMSQWNLSRVLFRAGQLHWGLMFAGFTIAGWQSATLPRWLAIPGLLFAALGLFDVVFIAWIMSGSAPELLLWTPDLLGVFWLLCASLVMLRRAKKN